MPKLSDAERQQAIYAAMTPEQRLAKKAQSRKTYLKTREEVIKRATARNKDPKNRSAHLATKARWQKKNPDRVRASSATRRARQLRAMPRWADQQAIYDKYALAFTISAIMGEPYHVDHVVPLSGRKVCGFHVDHNLQILHQDENKRKGNRLTV